MLVVLGLWILYGAVVGLAGAGVAITVQYFQQRG